MRGDGWRVGEHFRWDHRAEGILVWPSVLERQKPLSKEVDDLKLMGKTTKPHHLKKLTQLEQRPCGRRHMDLFYIEEHKASVAVKGGGAHDCWKKRKLTASLKTSLGLWLVAGDAQAASFSNTPLALGLNQHKEEKSPHPHLTGCSLVAAGGRTHGQSAGG